MRRGVLVAVAAVAMVSGAQAAHADPGEDGGFCVVLQDQLAPLPRSICVGHAVGGPWLCVQGRDRICIPPE